MPKGYGLHIGLNFVDPAFYDGTWIGHLDFSVNDAEAMRDITEGLDYEESILVVNELATRENVRKILLEKSNLLKEGDILVISFSGHGGSLPDQNGDEDDKMDETWCLYNGHMIDDELYVLYSKFKEGVRIFVVSDSCHSGTVTRYNLDKTDALFEQMIAESGLRTKSMSKQVARISYLKNKNYYNLILRQDSVDTSTIKASVKLLSGCQDNQKAYEGWGHGILTQRLLKIWDNGNYKGNYAQFHKRIAAEMMDFQSPNLTDEGRPNKEFDASSPFSI